MTTELEEQFFKVFGIKPIFRYFVQSELPIVGTDHCRPTYDLTKEQFKNFALSRAKGYKLVKVVKIYPEITDRKLLEMICILGNCKDGSKNLNLYTANKDEWFAVLKVQYNLAYCAAIDKDFKNAILKLCIYRADINDFKHQIQQLFKEEE